MSIPESGKTDDAPLGAGANGQGPPPPTPTRPLVWGVVFGLLGLAVDAVALPLLGGELPPFRVGAIVVLVVFIRLGEAPGLLAGLLTFAAVLGAGLGGAVLLVGRLLEAWIVSRLYRRSGSLVLSAALYWSTLGWLVSVVGLGWCLKLDGAAIGLFVVCGGLNGIVNAIGAQAALELLGLRSQQRVDPPSPQQLGPYAAGRFAWTVLAPTVLLVLPGARILYDQQMEHARANRREMVSAVAQDLRRLADLGRPSAEALGAVLEQARHEEQDWTLLDEVRGIVARTDDGARESPAALPRLSSALLGVLRFNGRFTVSEAIPPFGLTIVLDEPLLRLQAATVPSLLLILGLVLLPSVLLQLGVFRLARTLSLSFSRIDLAAQEIEAGQLSVATVLEDLARSPIAEMRRLGGHYGSLLNALAHYDALTGLPNRKLLLDRLSVACAQALARRENFALLFVDLDRFRVVDHSLGHYLGNELLRRIARRLKDCVGPADTVARVGGDEFSLLIPRMGGMEDATDTARKVMDIIKRPFILEGREIFVTASVGISLYPRDGQDAETILKNATAAAYVAKEKGQDSYRRYTARITARDAQRLTIESGLRRALEQGGLLVHYQPIVGMQTGQILAAEALVRWDRPEVGIVAAADFISVAEASGLIATIGSWVLRQATAEAKRWSDAGYPLRVAVNLSARQFQQPDLVEEVAHALREANLDPRLLEIEITEGSAMQDVERSVETLTGLRALGASIAVDDFGTGYSSLSYLKRFPVDRVKLDQSFVRDLTTSSDDAAIASAVIAMAHSLALEVVAEGVESEEQLAFLRRQGCDAMQGYLLSHAVPAEEFMRILEGGKPLSVPGTD